MTNSELVLNLIGTLLCDIQTLHSDVLTPDSVAKANLIVARAMEVEGIGFLTKALPRLGKALDGALVGRPLDAAECGFETAPGSSLPVFMGELFQTVLDKQGKVLQDPAVRSIKSLRQLLYCFYKYELPYDPETEKGVVNKFEQTESDVESHSRLFADLADRLDRQEHEAYREFTPKALVPVIQKARWKLFELFRHFDTSAIIPRHGPGAVSTRERLWDKWRWRKVSERILAHYPLDEYFYSSLTAVCDNLSSIEEIEFGEDSARVVLVPKDSRGPRLISCEPLVFQYVQQGLGRAIMRHVENHPLTRESVHFTDQQPNRSAALIGSMCGRYKAHPQFPGKYCWEPASVGRLATLDLAEASDRVSIGLVKLLFPGRLVDALMACRSLSTELPDGRVIGLHKYAPMGSALCFPVLALCVWAILSVGLPDAESGCETGLLVFGDDVIVPTAQAANAIELLESFGLKVNRDKSCIEGFFRESCGMDAFAGKSVTPVRFRTLWSSRRSPEHYASWIAYANSMFANAYYNTYDLIVGELFRIYGTIPSVEQVGNSAPSLVMLPDKFRPLPRRRDMGLQRLQYLCWRVRARVIKREIDGWSMMLRWFTSTLDQSSLVNANDSSRCAEPDPWSPFDDQGLLSVSSYTKPRATLLVKEWAPPTEDPTRPRGRAGYSQLVDARVAVR